MSPADREDRYQRILKSVSRRHDDPIDQPHNPPGSIMLPRQAALHARQHLTRLESQFFAESHTRWPGIRFRRYAPVSIILVVGERPSVWYAPFLCRPKKLIIVIDHREDFPYRIYGQNWKLYAQHGYTILDFSEDFSRPFDNSVWNEAIAMIDGAISSKLAKAA